MKKIAFITNFSKTEFYFELSKILESTYSADVYWISANVYWSNYLNSKGVSSNKILDLCRDDADFMVEHPKILGACNVNSLLALDRGWGVNESLTKKNLIAAENRITKFIFSNDIKFVIGEITWAIEILTKKICDKMNGVEFIFPHTMRVPSDRYLFFKDLEAEYLRISANKPDCKDELSEIVEKITSSGLKPFYFSLNNKIPGKFTISKAKLFLKYLKQMPLIKERGMMDVAIASLLRGHIKKIINYQRVRNIFQEINKDQSKFVLFGLQVQPESSVEVLGDGLSNQLELIRWISYHLPDDAELWVKEHSNALGVRSKSFYDELVKIPGVKLIDPFYPSINLIPQASAVASVSSTLCLEAALLGKPVILFSKPYFHGMKNVAVCRSPDDVKDFFDRKLLKNQTADLDHHLEALEHSHKGVIAGPLDYDGVMLEENLLNVAAGFQKLLGN